MRFNPAGRRVMRSLSSMAAVVVGSLSIMAMLAGTASAQGQTGSYTLNSFPTPTLYNEDEFVDGHTISPPANVPSTATITSVSMSIDWVPKPNPPGYYSSNTNYSAWLCLDPNDTQCTNVGPSYSGQNGWTATSTDFNGLNAATTTYHLAAGLFDSGGSGASYKAAINPFRYADSESITVNYTY